MATGGPAFLEHAAEELKPVWESGRETQQQQQEAGLSPLVVCCVKQVVLLQSLITCSAGRASTTGSSLRPHLAAASGDMQLRADQHHRKQVTALDR
ncbi:uncharacterized protein ACO6RY_00182 [Pungitius sinensis]